MVRSALLMVCFACISAQDLNEISAGSQKAVYGIYNLMCNTNITNNVRLNRMRCLLESIPPQFQPVLNQCRQQVSPGITDIDFLDQLCFNYFAQIQIASCTYTALLYNNPFGGSRQFKRQATSTLPANTFIESYINSVIQKCNEQHQPREIRTLRTEN